MLLIKPGIRFSPKHPWLPARQIQFHLSAREIFSAQGLEKQCLVSINPLAGYKHTPYSLLRSVNCIQGSQGPEPFFPFVCLFKVVFKLQFVTFGKQAHFQVLEVALHFGSCALPTMNNILRVKYVKATNP